MKKLLLYLLMITYCSAVYAGDEKPYVKISEYNQKILGVTVAKHPIYIFPEKGIQVMAIQKDDDVKFVFIYTTLPKKGSDPAEVMKFLEAAMILAEKEFHMPYYYIQEKHGKGEYLYAIKVKKG